MQSSPSPSSAIETSSHWDPLVVVLVGIICCVFLLFSYHKILQRHCGEFGDGIVFFSRRNRRGRRLNDEMNNLDSPSLQFQSRGLDSFLMHSLPITQFKKKKKDEEREQEEHNHHHHLHCHGNRNTDSDDHVFVDDCAVCLGEFEDGDWLKHLPNCSHVFHVSCIDTWFQSHSSCPLCRSFVYSSNLNLNHQNTVSIYALLEALRREENDQQERSHQFQVLQNQNFQGFESHIAIDIDQSTTTSRE